MRTPAERVKPLEFKVDLDQFFQWMGPKAHSYEYWLYSLEDWIKLQIDSMYQKEKS